MKDKKFCTYCNHPCETRFESGEFDADGPFGTIKGNLGDLDVSSCCGEPVKEIDHDD